MRRETAVRTPPPVRSAGAPGARQASPRILGIAALIIVAIAVAAALAVALTRNGNGSPLPSDVPKVGSATWKGALQGSTDVRRLFAGIPEQGLVLGSPNAPAMLTEFIDLQCPLCQEFESQQMPNLVTKYVRTGKLQIRMEPWSILSPPDSPRGQAATIAASLQNKAFQFAEMLYLNQGTEDTGWLTPRMVALAAASVDGLDVRRVLDEMGSSGVKSIVNDVDGHAATAKFDATPTILLNKRGEQAHVVSVGVPNAATLQSQIDAAVGG